MASIDYIVIAVYLLLLCTIAVMAIFRREETQENMILAGRRLTLPAFVATLVSTWYGGILGVGEFSFRYGISNWLVFGVPYYIAAALFALFLARKARRSNEMTIPDRLYSNYGRAASVAGSAVVVIVTLPVAYVLMIGVLLNIFFGIPVWVGIICGTFFSVFYVATGGFRAVVATDILQFILMFIGFALLLVYSVASTGGWTFLQTNLPPDHFSATGGNSIGYIALWYIIALATLVEPAFYQRCFAAKTVATARNGIFISIGFWIIFDFLTTSCGMYARAILQQIDNPVAAYPQLAVKLLPPGLLGLFLLSLLATIMSTVDSYMFIAATTISHDLIWRFRHFRENRIRAYTAVGLGVTSLATILIAVFNDSVIQIWHDFGSVGTASLLLPLMTSYWGEHKYSNRGALWGIIVAALVTTLGLFYPHLSPDGGYLFGIEPVFIGLFVSLTIFIVSRTPKIIYKDAGMQEHTSRLKTG